MTDKIHLNLSFHNLRSMIENLNIFCKNGRYAIVKILKFDNKRAVYLVRERLTNVLKVLKFIMQVNMTIDQINIYQYFLNLDHPNFCSIESFESIDRFYMIVQEHVDGLLLNEYFMKNPKKKYKYKILFELVFALDRIHDDSIIHGDIKPDNIIVKNNSPIILDFDLSKDLSTQIKKIKPFGTSLYMSPEMINDQYFDLKTDIWSLGMTLYTCIIKLEHVKLDLYSPAMHSHKSYDFDYMIQNMHNKKEYIQIEYGRLFFNSIRAMLLIDLDQRPSASDLKVLLMQSKYYDVLYKVCTNFNKLNKTI